MAVLKNQINLHKFTAPSADTILAGAGIDNTDTAANSDTGGKEGDENDRTISEAYEMLKFIQKTYPGKTWIPLSDAEVEVIKRGLYALKSRMEQSLLSKREALRHSEAAIELIERTITSLENPIETESEAD